MIENPAAAAERMTMDQLIERARQAAADRDKGASELLLDILPVLDEARRAGSAVTRGVVRAICETQPGMAPLWNACAAAAADLVSPGRFEAVRAELERAPAALTRVAAQALGDQALGVATPRFLTLSYSSAVRAALSALARTMPVEAVCGEGRPRMEGQRLAAALAAAGARVTVVTDAALTTFLPGATAVILGADAVTSRSWVNKVGTFGLAAAAALVGTPVLVAASRDKFVPPALEDRLSLQPGPRAEVWSDAPKGVLPANPIFEHTPLPLATQLLSDRGAVPASAAAELSNYWQQNALELLRLIG